MGRGRAQLGVALRHGHAHRPPGAQPEQERRHHQEVHRYVGTLRGDRPRRARGRRQPWQDYAGRAQREAVNRRNRRTVTDILSCSVVVVTIPLAFDANVAVCSLCVHKETSTPSYETSIRLSLRIIYTRETTYPDVCYL